MILCIKDFVMKTGEVEFSTGKEYELIKQTEESDQTGNYTLFKLINNSGMKHELELPDMESYFMPPRGVFKFGMR